MGGYRRWVYLALTVLVLLLLYRLHLWLQAHARQAPEYYLDLQLGSVPEAVTINYDRLGIPHVSASTLRAMAWATGWLHAQDRWYVLDAVRHWLRGTPAGTGMRLPAPGSCPLRDRARAWAAAWASNLSVRDRVRLDAYTAGFNAALDWMRDQNRLLGAFPEARRHLPEPWQPRDSLLLAAWVWARVGAGTRWLAREVGVWYHAAGLWDTAPQETTGACGRAGSPAVRAFFAGPLVPWVLWRWPTGEADTGVPWVAWTTWMPPAWPGPFYRMHWQFPDHYVVGDQIAGTPFWFAARMDFVAWLPYGRPDPDRFLGSSTQPVQGAGGPGRPDLFPAAPFPSARDVTSLLRDWDWPEVNWVVADFYGNQVLGPATLCPAPLRVERRQQRCPLEWAWRARDTAVMVCPGALCGEPNWGYPLWYELFLAAAGLATEPAWDGWAHMLQQLDATTLPRLVAAGPWRNAVRPDAPRLEAVWPESRPAPVLAPAYLFRLRTPQARPPIPVFFLPSAPPDATPRRLTLHLAELGPMDVDAWHWGYRTPRDQARVAGVWLWIDLHDVTHTMGLMFHPDNGLGGRVLGADIYREWEQTQPHRIVTRPDRLAAFTVGRQQFRPRRDHPSR